MSSTGTQLLFAIQEFINEPFVNARQVSLRIIDVTSSFRSRGGLDRRLQHLIGGLSRIEFPLTITGELGSNALGGLENDLIQGVLAVLIAYPKTVTPHGTP